MIIAPRFHSAGWGLAALVAITFGKYIDYLQKPAFAPVPLFLFAVALILFSRQDRLVSALVSSLVFLLIARSTLAPGILISTAPIWISAILAIGLVSRHKTLRVTKLTLLVVLLGACFVIPTLIQGNLSNSFKSIGIAASWILTFGTASNLSAQSRQSFMRFFVWMAVVQSIIAICETLIDVPFVRSVIAGDATDGKYIIRPNLILGDWTNRAQGTTGYPIPLAAFIVVAFVLLLFGNLALKRTTVVIVGSFLVVTLLLTGARSAFVALAVALAFAFAAPVWRSLRLKQKIRGLGWMLGALGLLVAIGILFFVRAYLSHDFSLVHRGGVLESAGAILSLPLLRVLFGSGYNSSDELFSSGILHSDGLQVIDNTLVTQLVYSGMLGLIALVVTISLGLMRGSQSVKAGLAAVTGYFFFYDIFNWHLSTFALFSLLGLAFPAFRSVILTESRQDIRPADPEAHSVTSATSA